MQAKAEYVKLQWLSGRFRRGIVSVPDLRRVEKWLLVLPENALHLKAELARPFVGESRTPHCGSCCFCMSIFTELADRNRHQTQHGRQMSLAIAQFKCTLELVPGYTPAHSGLAQCYTLKGTYREAYKEFNAAGTPLGDPDLNYVDVLTGKKKAPQALEALKRTVEHGYVDPYNMAILYCRLGDKEAAFACLEKAFAERFASMPQMKMEPWFDPLRSDRRFQDLLCRMNLPP